MLDTGHPNIVKGTYAPQGSVYRLDGDDYLVEEILSCMYYQQRRCITNLKCYFWVRVMAVG